MSACLSSGGSAAAYSFELEKLKSPPSSSTTTTTRAASPSSTITESTNSPLAISTRKPRTQRKRPNQSYNEAAALLSTAYPNIFSPSSINHLYAHKKTHQNPHFYGFDEDEAELLLLSESIEEPDFLFLPAIQARYSDQKEVNSGVSINESEVSQFEFSDEFDAGSILGEEVEEGIDSIMGKLEPGIKRGRRINRLSQIMTMNRGFKFAENIPLGLGLRSALRDHNDANRWRIHTVDFDQISPRIQTVDDVKTEVKKSKKKKKKVAAAASTESSKEETEERSGHPMLKLDYDGVLEAWSDKATPFPDEILGSEATGADVNARLAQIDLFGDNGVREASVLRYKEKRQTRLFSKKIRYQVRKLNADQRPRVKMGTFTSLRKAYGALKDSTTVGLAKVNSEFKDLDIAIVKATNHVESPPKERHVRKRLECYRVLKYDIEAERLPKASGAASRTHRTRMLSGEDLLEQLPALQQLLFRLIGCQPEGAAYSNYLIHYALALVLKESFKIYCAINDGIINLVDMFFEMTRHDAVKALNIYNRAGQQAENLAEFYDYCKGLELARNFQFPTLRQPPPSFLATMEEYIKEAPQSGSVQKKLEYEEKEEEPEPQEEEQPEEPAEDENQNENMESDQPLIKEEQEEPQEEKEEEEAKPSPLIDTDDLLGLNEINPQAAEIEEKNALALAIYPAGHETSGPSNSLSLIEAGGSGWELALVTPQNNNNNNNNNNPRPTIATKLSLRRRHSKKTDPINQCWLWIWSHGYNRRTSLIEPVPVWDATRSFCHKQMMMMNNQNPYSNNNYSPYHQQHHYFSSNPSSSSSNPFGDAFLALPAPPSSATQQQHNHHHMLL
ncbi:hypothetical protein HID58_046108 [Brassica napus]|uniref:CCT domain-containing protein n=1 Tax=Brassica napus TaxID=3708 RepID=A0ABQ8AVG1_BRANA|nr:hypothetical protein HID58_046108 [Brassica napus]